MSSVELSNDGVLVKHATRQLMLGIYQTPRVRDNSDVTLHRDHTIDMPKRPDVPGFFSAVRLYNATDSTSLKLPAEDGLKASNYFFSMKGISFPALSIPSSAFLLYPPSFCPPSDNTCIEQLGRAWR